MSDKQATDQQLVERVQAGDKRAFDLLVLKYQHKITSLVGRYVKDHHEAMDVTQEAFLRLWQFAPSWEQGNAHVSTWLYRVVSNLCKDRYRRPKLEDLDVAKEPTDETQSPADKIDDHSRQKALYGAMSLLPENQRLAVQFRHIDELTNPEIAEIMGLSVEAVESLTARGKRKLIEFLASYKTELGYTHG